MKKKLLIVIPISVVVLAAAFFLLFEFCHFGGSATCLQRADCWLCGEQYGELAEHSCENEVCTMCKCSANGLTYTLNSQENAYEVSWDKSTKLDRVYIPSTYNDLPVTKIADNAFSLCDTISFILFSQNIEQIGEFAFFRCTNLGNVTFPASLKQINRAAFQLCRSMTSVYIPLTLSVVQNHAFADCNALTIYCQRDSVYEQEDEQWQLYWAKNGDYSVYNAPVVWNCDTNNLADDGLYYVEYKGIRYSIGDEYATVSRQSVSLTQANVEQTILFEGFQYTVTQVDESAFADCALLKKVSLPSTIESMGDYAFSNCVLLESVNGDEQSDVNLPDNVSKIGYKTFDNCNSLRKINLGENVKKLDTFSFYRCDNLQYVILHSNNLVVSWQAFFECQNTSLFCLSSEQPQEWNNTWCVDCLATYWGNEWSLVEGVPVANEQ